MKKNIIFCLCVAGMAWAADAQTKLNNQALLLLDEWQTMPRTLSTEEKCVDVLVLVTPDVNYDDINSLGAKITLVDGDVIGVSLPISNLERLADVPGVEYVEYGNNSRPLLDFARPSGLVDVAQTGFDYDGSSHSYNGSGIVTGLFDQGVDPNHVNFFDKNGVHRVKKIYNFTGSGGTCSSPAPGAFGTDDESTSHGTHVAGIMAGSYNGEGRYGYVTTPTGSAGRITNGNIPYYGVATSSDIVMACGTFTDANIIAAVRNIFDYAQSVGKPAVVNLSIGSNSGPHDGSDLLCTRIAEQAKRGIVCVSAGNEGNDPIFLYKKFSTSDQQLKSFFTGNEPSGSCEVWAGSSKPLKVSVVVFSKNTGAITEVATVTAAGQKASTSGVSAFVNNFNGTLNLVSSVNARNDRFTVAIQSSAVSQRNTSYFLGILVEGTDGQEAYVYGNKNKFTSNSRSGWTNGAYDGTINTIACASNVVSVGAYTSRTTWATLSGSTARYNENGYAVNKISPFSSWGKKFGAGWLPNVCAPGANIVSSFNSYENVNESYMVAKVTKDNRAYYWGGMQGTSMSCPFASGVVALWLEACPSLTIDQVYDVIDQTSVSQNTESGGIILPGLDDDIEDTDKYRWGAGKLDAVAGLKYILGKYSSVGNIYQDEMNVIISANGGVYNVFAAGENGLKVSLFDMQGRCVKAESSLGNELDVDTNNLVPGIYVLHVEGANTKAIRKIQVK